MMNNDIDHVGCCDSSPSYQAEGGVVLISDDDEDLERAQVSTRGLNKGLVRPDENFNNDDLELTQVTQVRLWDTVHGKMIDAESDADYLNGSPGPSSPEKLSFPTSRPQSKNELRESVDSGQERVDALLEAEEDYD